MSSSEEGLAAFLAARYADTWAATRDRELRAGLAGSYGTRDISAKREILAMWLEGDGYDLPAGVHEGRDDPERLRDEGIKDTLESVVRQLATEFSDHPDYRPEWKP